MTDTESDNFVFHSPAKGDHCGVTFYKDGTCILHHDDDERKMLWVVIDGYIYFKQKKNDNYSSKIPDHMQDDYQNYLADQVLLT